MLEALHVSYHNKQPPMTIHRMVSISQQPTTHHNTQNGLPSNYWPVINGAYNFELTPSLPCNFDCVKIVGFGSGYPLQPLASGHSLSRSGLSRHSLILSDSVSQCEVDVHILYHIKKPVETYWACDVLHSLVDTWWKVTPPTNITETVTTCQKRCAFH